jgi:hypothetical protein
MIKPKELEIIRLFRDKPKTFQENDGGHNLSYYEGYIDNRGILHWFVGKQFDYGYTDLIFADRYSKVAAMDWNSTSKNTYVFLKDITSFKSLGSVENYYIYIANDEKIYTRNPIEDGGWIHKRTVEIPKKIEKPYVVLISDKIRLIVTPSHKYDIVKRIGKPTQETMFDTIKRIGKEAYDKLPYADYNYNAGPIVSEWKSITTGKSYICINGEFEFKGDYSE